MNLILWAQNVLPYATIGRKRITGTGFEETYDNPIRLRLLANSDPGPTGGDLLSAFRAFREFSVKTLRPASS